MTMVCPICGEPTIVTDSRSDVDAVYRSRRCKGCGYTFNTIEVDDSTALDGLRRCHRIEKASKNTKEKKE